jgi:hypothetical protein
LFSKEISKSLPTFLAIRPLPTKNGGLYHVLADTFFTLEDGTQIVYFYGEQSIVSTESSKAAYLFSKSKG